MASIPTLFNLDPTQFALGRNTGRFKQLVGAPTTQNPAELGNLLQGITGITAARPEDFSLEKPVLNIPAEMQGKNFAGNLSAAQADRDKWDRLANNLRGANLTEAGKQVLRGYESNLSIAQGYLNTAQSEYNAYNSVQEAFKKEADAYNTALQSYKTKAETYAADVNRYLGEQETARNKFQSEYLGQDVEDPNILASGDVLAASSLYSDQLHQQMIERIAEANADVMPGSDQVTSLYS